VLLRDDLLAAIEQAVADAVGRLHTHGIVTVADPLEVRLNDDTTATPLQLRDTLYVPAVGDLVRLGRYGADWIVEGPFDDTSTGNGGGDHSDADHADAFSPLGHGHSNIAVADTRAVNGAPSAYAQGVHWEFKEAAAIGVAASGYAALQTVKPWGDSSGGSAYQVAHHDGVSWRRWAAAGGGAWGAWSKWFEDTGWLTPSFLNSWTDYSASYPFRYRRLNGVVFLAGIVKSGTVNTNIAVLPVGYRPTWDLYFTSHGYTGSAYVEAHWTIQANGNVRHLSGGNVQVSLAGISFPADA
jgi:hypothetical protein